MIPQTSAPPDHLLPPSRVRRRRRSTPARSFLRAPSSNPPSRPRPLVVERRPRAAAARLALARRRQTSHLDPRDVVPALERRPDVTAERDRAPGDAPEAGSEASSGTATRPTALCATSRGVICETRSSSRDPAPPLWTPPPTKPPPRVRVSHRNLLRCATSTSGASATRLASVAAVPSHPGASHRRSTRSSAKYAASNARRSAGPAPFFRSRRRPPRRSRETCLRPRATRGALRRTRRT